MGLATGHKQTMKGLWHPLVEKLPQEMALRGEKAEQKHHSQSKSGMKMPTCLKDSKA